MGPWDWAMPADTARELGEEVDWFALDYANFSFPLGVGAKDGTKKMIDLINAWPGTFMFAAYSEGTIVAKNVELELASGSLQHRYDDWVCSVKWGDACREKGKWFGDPKDPGGQGISGPDNWVNTPDKIRSFVYPWNEGDVYTNCPDTQAGKRMTLVYQLVIERWNGELKSILAEAQDLLKEPLANVISIVSAIFKYINFVGPQAQAPHMNYPIDDAVAFIRQKMVEVPARTVITV
jgi:hypothetical protein